MLAPPARGVAAGPQGYARVLPGYRSLLLRPGGRVAKEDRHARCKEFGRRVIAAARSTPAAARLRPVATRQESARRAYRLRAFRSWRACPPEARGHTRPPCASGNSGLGRGADTGRRRRPPHPTTRRPRGTTSQTCARHGRVSAANPPQRRVVDAQAALGAVATNGPPRRSPSPGRARV